MIEMNGKLVILSDCYCCNLYNTKKLKTYRSKDYLEEAKEFFAKTEPGKIGYDGTSEYPHIAKLFSTQGQVQIWCDTPFGDEVIFVDGKYSGYINEWEEMIRFCDNSNYKYSTPAQVFDYYLKNVYGDDDGDV